VGGGVIYCYGRLLGAQHSLNKFCTLVFANHFAKTRAWDGAGGRTSPRGRSLGSCLRRSPASRGRPTCCTPPASERFMPPHPSVSKRTRGAQYGIVAVYVYVLGRREGGGYVKCQANHRVLILSGLGLTRRFIFLFKLADTLSLSLAAAGVVFPSPLHQVGAHPLSPFPIA